MKPIEWAYGEKSHEKFQEEWATKIKADGNESHCNSVMGEQSKEQLKMKRNRDKQNVPTYFKSQTSF